MRDTMLQALVVAAIVLVGAYLVGNLQAALGARNIATGFDFLRERANFAIGESLIPFTTSDSFGRAYVVGLLNTLYVSLASIAGATVIGVVLGFARLSTNWLLSGFARLYVELFRNTPQLVQIIFWYALVTHLPHPRSAFEPVSGILLSNRGLFVPTIEPWGVFLVTVAAAVAGVAVAVIATSRRVAPGRPLAARALAIACGALLPPLAVLVASGASFEPSLPELRGLNVAGGGSLTPEFTALFLGLSLYIAAFIAEIVRAGVQSVPRGQVEAARALGLSPGPIRRLVVFPQALRIMIPPAAAQYVSLVKNSSLGIAIGYPELFNINNTILVLSGHILEAIAIMMAVYLSISLAVGALMNLYNRRVQLKER